MSKFKCIDQNLRIQFDAKRNVTRIGEYITKKSKYFQEKNILNQ